MGMGCLEGERSDGWDGGEEKRKNEWLKWSYSLWR
jgi:hypothetical protein